MQPPSPVLGLRQKAAIGAVGTMEETMRIRTLTELMRLSRNELFDLAALITTMLTHYPEHSPDRFVADTNLRNIRKELLRRKWSP
jgi:hypothetical protein